MKYLISYKIFEASSHYNLDRIYEIINKTLKDKFNVIQDKTNDRVIVASRGKYI